MDLKKAAINSTKWTSVSLVIQVIVQLLRLSILTRFLTKSDFGLVAIVTLVLGFTHIFTDLGISVVLFSKREISKKEYSSLYWVSILLGCILYSLLMLTTPLIALFYKLEILKVLIPIMGLDLIFATAGRQFKIFKQKDLRFKEIAIIEIIAAVSSLSISVFLAYTGWGVFSLVYSTIFNSLIVSALLIIRGLKTHPISFIINIKENKPLYKIGLYQTGAQVLDFISNQLDIILIGKIMGPADLGAYNLIKQLVIRPYSLLNPIIQNVGVPILAKLKEDMPKFNNSFLQLLRLVSFVNFPLYALIALYAREIITILYGSSYINAALPLQILCIWGALASLLGSASMLVVVTGKTNLGFYWTVFRMITNPIFIFIGSIWAIVGISIGQALCILSYLVFYWFFLIRRASAISLKDYTSSYLNILIKTIVSFWMASMVKRIQFTWSNVFITDVLTLFVFLLIYGFLNKSLIKGNYKQFAVKF